MEIAKERYSSSLKYYLETISISRYRRCRSRSHKGRISISTNTVLIILCGLDLNRKAEPTRMKSTMRIRVRICAERRGNPDDKRLKVK